MSLPHCHDQSRIAPARPLTPGSTSTSFIIMFYCPRHSYSPDGLKPSGMMGVSAFRLAGGPDAVATHTC